MEFKTGNIYLVRYREYKHDPTPLILVLYPGHFADFHSAKPMELMHAINLNYLKSALSEGVYKMIALIVTKQLSGRDTHALYHDYIKNNLHPVIRHAYRTYNPAKITNPKLVSKGFNESLGFIQKMKLSLTRSQKQQQVERLVKTKVDAAKAVERISTSIISHGLNSTISLEEAEKRARLYMAEIQKAKRPEEIDFTKFTRLLALRKKP
jgi:hypothetical protein